MTNSVITKDNYPEVARIYAEGIATGVATFETDLPDWKYWNKAHLPFGRIGMFENNEMLGWAALSSVSTRRVYKGVAEVSLYVSVNSRSLGIGKRLLDQLIKISEQHEVWTLQSGVFRENRTSIELHQKCGFRIVGYKEKIGQLRGIWFDNVLLERRSKVVGIN